MTIPLDPPAVPAKKTPDTVQLQQDAEELARLSAAIPDQIKDVNHKLPKELNDQLKQIEKLAKRLRSEISQ
jgi:sensor domain CHASE-containing protein